MCLCLTICLSACGFVRYFLFFRLLKLYIIIVYSEQTQLEPYKGAPFYVHAHPNKTGKSKGAKTLPNPTAPGTESERRTREDTQG